MSEPRKIEVVYRTPLDRTLSTASREAIQAGVLIALTGLAELVATLMLDTSLGARTIALMVLTILLKAAITVVAKWERASTEG